MNVGRYGAALQLLQQHAGAEFVALIDAGRSSEDRAGVWSMCSSSGAEIASVDVRNNTVMLRRLGDLKGEIGFADIQSVRVLCRACRQPKVIIGAPRPGHYFPCSRCKRILFVQ